MRNRIDWKNPKMEIIHENQEEEWEVEDVFSPFVVHS